MPARNDPKSYKLFIAALTASRPRNIFDHLARYQRFFPVRRRAPPRDQLQDLAKWRAPRKGSSEVYESSVTTTGLGCCSSGHLWPPLACKGRFSAYFLKMNVDLEAGVRPVSSAPNPARPDSLRLNEKENLL